MDALVIKPGNPDSSDALAPELGTPCAPPAKGLPDPPGSQTPRYPAQGERTGSANPAVAFPSGKPALARAPGGGRAEPPAPPAHPARSIEDPNLAQVPIRRAVPRSH